MFVLSNEDSSLWFRFPCPHPAFECNTCVTENYFTSLKMSNVKIFMWIFSSDHDTIIVTYFIWKSFFYFY